MRLSDMFVFVTLCVFGCSVSGSAEVSFSGSALPPEHKLSLWYRQPATNWMTSALPIGNGRIGAMVFGGVQQEHLQFNDKSLWTGGKSTRGAYQNFGDLYIDFPGLTAVTDYRRELDLEDGIARVCYHAGNVEFTREYFASYPDNIIVMRFTASRPSALNLTINLVDAHSGTKTRSTDTITISGTLTLLDYEARVRVLNEGGTLSPASNQITVTNANAVTVLLAAGTNYDPTSPTYTGPGLQGRVTDQISGASGKSYARLKADHIADYQSLFDRVSFSLDDRKPAIATDELLAGYNAGNCDPALEVLYFQFGRYLMIGSSRGMALPANLQGLWNNSNNPPWQCDIHSNINIQMNYWPAEVTNLSECHKPYLDYIYNEAMVHPSWRQMASSLGHPGWTLKTQNNIFAYSDWNWNRPANAWYCMHLWQHYAYTLDTEFLSARAYPVMKSACEFWVDRLIVDTDGRLVAPDEWSPEQGPWENGVSYAQQLIWDLFKNTEKASETLGIDADFRNTLQSKLTQMDAGVHLGSWGQLREWKYTDDDPANEHRHISHLIGLYPGSQISPLLDPLYSDAARVSLNARGDGGTGWSRAWKICTWARLLDGDHAYILLKNALRVTTAAAIVMTDAGGVYENLLDAHPPFQIDGNFGATAGIAEMLLQSHLGPMQFLPALPKAWPSGQITGLRATGGFEVNLRWNASQLTEAMIKSNKGQRCRLRGSFTITLPDGAPVAAEVTNGLTSFDTREGVSYRAVLHFEDRPGAVHDYGKSGDDPATEIDESAILASDNIAENKQYAESSRYAMTANDTPVSVYKYQKGRIGSGYYNFDVARFSSVDRTPTFRIELKDGTRIETIEIYPARYYAQEALRVSDDRKVLTFSMSEKLPYCIVNINGTLTDKSMAGTPMLAVINDPPETNRPDVNAANVLNFREFAADYLKRHPITDQVGQQCRPAGTVTDTSRNTTEQFTWHYGAGKFVEQKEKNVSFPNKRASVGNDVSEAFQAALEIVKRTSELDTIYFPAGTYIWSGLFIKNWNGNGADGRLNIYLDEDALLVNRLQECKEALEPAIGIWYSSNITISGRGIIDGNACYTLTLDRKDARDTPHQGGAMVVHSEDITFNDTYVRDVKQWNWECHTVRNMTYNNIKGLSPFAHAWVDGLDLTSGRNVTVNGAFTLGNDDTFASGHYNPSDEFPRRFLDELDRAKGEDKARMEAMKHNVCAAAAVYNRDRLKWDTDDSENITVNDALCWSGLANNIRFGANTRWKGEPGHLTSYKLRSYTFNNFNSVMRRCDNAIKVHNGSHGSYPEYETLIFRNCSFAGNTGDSAAIPAGSDLNNFNPHTVVIENCWFTDPARPMVFKSIQNFVLKDIFMSGNLLTHFGQAAIMFDKIGTLTFTANGKKVVQED